MRYGVPARTRVGIALDAEDEPRAGQDALEPALDAGLERCPWRGPRRRTAASAAARRRRPAAVGAACQPRRESASRTRARRLRGAGRPAREDLAAARRVARAGGVERPGDRHASGCAAAPSSRSCRRSCAGTAAGARRPSPPCCSTNATATSCGPAVTGTRTRIRGFDRVARVGRLLEHRRQIGRCRRSSRDAPAGRRSRFRTRSDTQAADDVQVGAIELGLEVVLAVEREDVAHAHAADRAERQAVDVLVLRQVLRHAIGVAARADRRVADGQAR